MENDSHITSCAFEWHNYGLTQALAADKKPFQAFHMSGTIGFTITDLSMNQVLTN